MPDLERFWIALRLWLVHGLQWRDQYMKFGFRTAWSMAGTCLEFRAWLKERGLEIVKEL